MVTSDLQGGSISFTYSGSTRELDCTLGSFELQDIVSPDGGGLTTLLLGKVQVAREDLPNGFEFTRDLDVTVTPNTGQVRACAVYSIDDSGALIDVTLRDQNHGA